MGSKVNLLELNLKSFSLEQKRQVFFMMDLMMKQLHDSNMMITDFNPSNIYYQEGIFMFDKVSPISAYYSDNRENAILRNVLGLSNLAFCTYLPDYRLEQGLLSYDVVHQRFNNFAFYMPEQDRAYYKSILVDSMETKRLPDDNIYYSDYVSKQHKNSGNSNGFVYIKSTDIGKAFAQSDEAAFGHNFFFMAMAASVCVALVGVVVYFSSYLG